MSVDGSKEMSITEMPCKELDVSRWIPGTPLTCVSIGVVTSISTCSGVSPGASVCMLIVGGANSGKTSYFALTRLASPKASSRQPSAITAPRCRTENAMIAAWRPVVRAPGGGGTSIAHVDLGADLLRQEHLRARNDQQRSGRQGARRQNVAAVRLRLGRGDLPAAECVAAGPQVYPGVAIEPDDRRCRNRDSLLDITRGKLRDDVHSRQQPAGGGGRKEITRALDM